MATKVRIYRKPATVGWRKAIVSVVVVFFPTVSSSFVPSLPSWHGGGGGGVLFERMGRTERNDCMEQLSKSLPPDRRSGSRERYPQQLLGQ